MGVAAKLPFDWQRLTMRKTAIIDSTVASHEEANRAEARARLRLVLPEAVAERRPRR
jgi:hypothetical protein